MKMKEDVRVEIVDMPEVSHEKSEKIASKVNRADKKVPRHTVVSEEVSVWKYVSFALIIVLLISLGYNFGFFGRKAAVDLSGAQPGLPVNRSVAESIVDTLNKNFLNGAKASLSGFEERFGLLLLRLSVDDKPVEVYATKDGSLLFTAFIDLEGSLPEVQPVIDGRVNVSADDDPYIGSPNASVTIVEFSDYQCPFCARAEPVIKEILEKYGDRVKIVYRDFPLGFHKFAQKAAEASECADEQGKFWEYHDVLFEKQAEWSSGGIDKLKAFASELELDVGKFNECLDSGKYAEEVQKDFSDGQIAGVSGTPAFFINGIEVSGAQPFSVFEKIIENELNEKN